MSAVHPKERLPGVFHRPDTPNGHAGSHLVDDFVKAVVHHKLPPVHAWAAASYTVPGLIAHFRRKGWRLAGGSGLRQTFREVDAFGSLLRSLIRLLQQSERR